MGSAQPIYVNPYTGLPSSDGNIGPIALPSADPGSSVSAGIFDSISNYASSAVNEAETIGSQALEGIESGAGAVAHSVGNGAKAVVTTVYDAGKTVVGDVAGGAEHLVDFGTSKIYILVAMLLVGLYFIGTTGAVKISR